MKYWLKLETNNNPLVFDTEQYLTKVGKAFQIGGLGVLGVMSLAILGFLIVLIGALRGWF